MHDPASGPPQHVPDGPEHDGARSWDAPLRGPSDAEGRAADAFVCPFLRATDEGGGLGLPIEAPDPANRCAAFGAAVPQSLRQQELVCLGSAHRNCPRYLRGSFARDEALHRATARRTLTPAIASALVILVVAFLVSLGFVIVNGGIALTAAATSVTGSGREAVADTTTPATGAAVLEPTTTPIGALTPGPTAVLTAVPTASRTPEATLSPTPSPTPTVTPSVTPIRTPAPTPRTTPRPVSSRYALLTVCPGASNCYLYAVQTGDNLDSIANDSGVALKTVRAMNPWTQGGLTIGRELRLPRPTR